HWLESAGSPADVIGDDSVNLADYAVLVDHFLEWGESTGSLEVQILPQGAIDAGAEWKVERGTWQSSGNTLTLPVGFHTLEYKMVDGWTEPLTSTVHVREGETTSLTGTYVLLTGGIRVRISPDSAIDLGAKWRINGGQWLDNDHLEPNLPSGTYNIEFRSIDGWARPDDMTVEVSNGLVAAVEVAYKHPIVINEFLASNSYFNTDPQGEDDDWIELYNRGEEAIDVGGMYMTDQENVPTKWMIPDDNPAVTTIEPNDYLLIWADGDVTDSPGLHAGFELDDGGDEIYLFDSNSAILIDEMGFPSQDPNVSYGRYPDGNDVWRAFGMPTPDSQNIPMYDGFVADVKFSHDRGYYEAPFSLTMACETELSDIYYTLNGDEPGVFDGRNFSGTRYVGPLTITKTTCLLARAVRGGWMPSDIDAQSYIFLDDVITQPSNPEGFPTMWRTTSPDYGMDTTIVNDHIGTIKDDLRSLPVMSLVMKTGDLFDYDYGIYSNPRNEGFAWERPGSVELFYPDGSDDGFQINCGVRIYGGVGRNENYRKKTFRFLFKGMYGATKLRFPLFGDEAVDEFDTIIIRANFNDGYPWGGADSQFIRDEWMRRANQALGHPQAIGTFVHLYINGLYWGLYNPVQRPDMAFSSSYYPGDKDEWDGINSTRSVGGSSRTAWNTMLSMCNSSLSTNEEYQRLQGNDPDGANNPAYEDYLDVDQYISFLITNFYGGNNDWMSHNWYAGRRRGPESCGWKAYTWDAEWVLGMRSGVNENSVGDTTSSGYLLKPYTYLRNNIEFKLLFADYAHQAFYNGGPLYVDSSAPTWDPYHPERN
ncbi:MAG: lamin tail domain-containing protein, partial [Planctomycetota bacterium]